MLTRRRWLAALAAGGLLPAAWRANAIELRPTLIPQPVTRDHAAFIERAFEMRGWAERNGDQAFGAVVVKNGVIIGQSPSRVVTAGDGTGHAELEALREAAHLQGAEEVAGAVLYSSFKPCPMCESAAFWAGIDRFYFGREINDGGVPKLGSC